jgi:hypothetical protein
MPASHSEIEPDLIQMVYRACGKTPSWVGPGSILDFSQAYLFLSLTNGGCPIQARFWLEWDSTAPDRSFLYCNRSQIHDHLHPEQSAVDVRAIPLKPKPGLNGAPTIC